MFGNIPFIDLYLAVSHEIIIFFSAWGEGGGVYTLMSPGMCQIYFTITFNMRIEPFKLLVKAYFPIFVHQYETYITN